MRAEQLEMELAKLIESCIGIYVQDRTKNLLDTDVETATVNWLYVFSEIEERYPVNLEQIMAEGEYESFTIQGLAEKVIGKAEGS